MLQRSLQRGWGTILLNAWRDAHRIFRGRGEAGLKSATTTTGGLYLRGYNNTALQKRGKAECIVELYKHAGIFKNTREVQRSTSRRRVLLALLECSKKFPRAYITLQFYNARGTSFFFISFIK